MVATGTPNLSEHYGDGFYEWQVEGSLRSAMRYAEYLSKIYRPRSVVDIGCGRGAWLKAFKHFGAETAVGFDGPWNSQENMLDPAIRFEPCDLNSPETIKTPQRFALAISLEVAEHLEEKSAKEFVRALIDLSDVVMFGAAYVQQGGTNHLNEQTHTYWARHFKEHHFAPFDLFRPKFWGDKDIEYWYQQNTFLYVKEGSEAMNLLNSLGHHAMPNTAFMDCIHPALYGAKIAPKTASAFAWQVVNRITPRKLRRIAKKFVAPKS